MKKAILICLVSLGFSASAFALDEGFCGRILFVMNAEQSAKGVVQSRIAMSSDLNEIQSAITDDANLLAIASGLVGRKDVLVCTVKVDGKLVGLQVQSK